MHRKPLLRHVLVSMLLAAPFTPATAATISGIVVDANGNALPGIQVVYTRQPESRGASVVTVFTGSDGRFRFPDDYPERLTEESDIRTRGLGYQQLQRLLDGDRRAANLTFVMKAVANQVDVAPASAWLHRIEDHAEQAKFIMNCIDCHQVPASEVRAYAASIDDLHAPDPLLARQQSWDGIVKYMNFLSVWEFSRGRGGSAADIDTDAVYSVENEDEVSRKLAEIFDDRLDHIEGYDWGAPVIANEKTAIWEYEVPEPNAIREAMMLGNPAKLLAADVSSNRIIAIDVATGEQEALEVPVDYPIGPHSLHRDNDGLLWITPLFNNTVATLNPDTEAWQTWRLQTAEGRGVGIHDLSFGFDHELLKDDQGRVWFSDIGNRAVGYFDPETNVTEFWQTPIAESRANDAALYGSPAVYGLIMTRDRKEVWYSQLGNGVFGGFNIETQEFIGPFVLPDPNAGPRRITISDDDVMYLALYGTGQLAEFDIKSRTMLGIYDLPDTASAPYSATWDPVRRAVWVATSNGDVIYRFDAATKEFGVLPLPRERSFLRMIDIDPATGVLVSSYANIVEVVNGPRMALIVDPGDGAYPQQFSPANATAPSPGNRAD
jgi:streptogramin lyase